MKAQASTIANILQPAAARGAQSLLPRQNGRQAAAASSHLWGGAEARRGARTCTCKIAAPGAAPWSSGGRKAWGCHRASGSIAAKLVSR